MIDPKIQSFINQLHEDFKRLCEQMGIPESHKLSLATGKDEYRDMFMRRCTELKLNYKSKNVKVCYERLGWCDSKLGIIFVDCHIKRIMNKTLGYKQDATYEDHEDTLIHELVHYRFNIRGHPKKLFKLIDRVKAGESFSLMEEKKMSKVIIST
jgi:hypothetical protein